MAMAIDGTIGDCKATRETPQQHIQLCASSQQDLNIQLNFMVPSSPLCAALTTVSGCADDYEYRYST